MGKIMQHLKNFKLEVKEKVLIPMKVMHRFFIEFCKNSNIHGLRYFTERTLHWSERLWWIVAIGLSLWLCGSMIRTVWVQWDEYPTTIQRNKEHISRIPFPSVSVCSRNRIMAHKLDIFSKFNKKGKLVANLSDIEVAQLNALSHICSLLPSKIEYKDVFTNESIYNIIEDVTPNLEYIIKECRWKQKIINCSEYISPILTAGDGLCFTFNNLNFHDVHTNEFVPHAMIAKNNPNLSGWSLEEGYSNEFTESEYPVRVFDSGQKEALELTLTSYTHDYDQICNGKSAHNFFQIDSSDDTLIAVKPKFKTTSEEVRSNKPVQRVCYYNSEHQLRFFKTYNKENCHIECISNITKEKCGCAKFSMPRDANTKICGAAQIKCYEEAGDLLGSVKNGSSIRGACACDPTCAFIEYEADLDRAMLSTNPIGKTRESQTKGAFQQQTKVTIFFKDDYIETKHMVETYTWGDFLAICGGLLGLFLGISLLSIIELIYYSTLRLLRIVYWSKSERNEEQEQSDQTEIDAIDINRNAFTIQNQTVQKLLRFFSGVRAFFIELCDDSNIHGVRYFSERGLHWSERLWWLVAFGLSMWLCGSMIHNVWIQWLEDPMTMSFDKKHAKLATIEFPTVTICPEIKTTKDKLDLTSAIRSLSNLPDIEMKRLHALAHVCPRLPHLITYKDNFTDESIYTTIQDLAPNVQESYIKCTWQHRSRPCSTLLTPVLTDEGLCFTFNALNSHEIYTDEMAPGMMIVKNNPNISGWSLETGYENYFDKGNYPFQAIGDTVNSLVSIMATRQRDIDLQCRGFDMGYKLILTTPGETVKTSQNYVRLPISVMNMLEVKAKLTITSKSLYSYTPNQRQCFHSYDNSLRFFKIYTKTNCEAECMSNFTRIECGCVKFSMPRDKQTKICGGANIKCYKSAQKDLFTSEVGENFRKKCNCLPSCVSVEYYVENWKTAVGQTTLYRGMGISLLGLQFTSTAPEIIERKAMYNFGDFLAACGSLLGLFVGVSLLSIIELIYYSTLRLYWTIKLKRNDH